MANAMYAKAKQEMLDGTLPITTSTIKIALIDSSGYTYSSAHTSLNDVLVADVVATSGALASKTATGGTFDAADVTFTAVTGNPIAAYVVYKDTGTRTTSTLIAYFDHDAAAAAIALTPNGSDILITFDALGIFTL